MKRQIWGVLLATATILGTLAIDASAQSENLPSMPPISTSAPASDGTTVLCYGSTECAQVIAELQLLAALNSTEQTLDRDPPIDKTQFCSKLKNKRPGNCSSSAAPSTPINDSNWAPNGCGDGSWQAAIASVLVGIPLPWLNLNHPATDVVFTPACNGHDRCYATGSKPRLDCDTDFRDNMGSICADSYNPTCSSYQSAYFNAVRQFGAEPYAQWATNRQCALWHMDMEANNCAKQ